MVDVEFGPMHPMNEKMENHPDISDLINIIAFAEPLMVAEGGSKYVIVGSMQPGATKFMFTKTDKGYLLERKD